MPARPLITLTTDFGYDDPFVGVMKGVILSINPDAEIVDFTHGIRPYNIKEAAYSIGMNYLYFPHNTIHIVVVDPGVGSGRRPVIVYADKHYFIGPDNGVFSYIFSLQHEAVEVVHITADHYFLSANSPTFQAKDIFAPVAAWFSRGVSLSKFGDAINDYETVALSVPDLSREGMITGEVIHIDRFGNAIVNVTRAEMNMLCDFDSGGMVKIMFKNNEIDLKPFYEQGDDDRLHAIINSSGFLEFFIYRGNASSRYKISTGDQTEIICG
jgi:hypothetical protein